MLVQLLAEDANSTFTKKYTSTLLFQVKLNQITEQVLSGYTDSFSKYDKNFLIFNLNCFK